MTEPDKTEPTLMTASSQEAWLDKESFGFGLIGGALISGVFYFVADTVFEVTPVYRAISIVIIALGLAVWFWRKRPRK